MIGGVIASGLQDAVRFFEALPDIAEQAAALAINDVSQREGLTGIRRRMRDQINFPSGYLETNRLTIRKKASRKDLTSIISGRDRATSLARFAEGQTPRNTRNVGVRVKISKGKTTVLRKAFILPLRNGNQGVAIRLPAGQRPSATDGAVQLGTSNVWLLYGPSVDQVFRSVAAQQTGDITNALSRQFLRQFTRLSSGRI